MVITKKAIQEFENTHCKFLPEELKGYLLTQYSQEPFPYEYSEQDLWANMARDVRAYEAGKLDVTPKSPSERWKEERENLQKLYTEKAYEACELADYVLELEQLLLKHGLESSKMAQRRLEDADPTLF